MLSIIIPARDESENLEQILNYFSEGLKTIDYEVILIMILVVMILLKKQVSYSKEKTKF